MSDNAIAPPSDDLQEVMTSWGKMPKWKARALALGEMQAALVEHVRDDSAHDDQPMTTALGPEGKEPPALAADQVEREARAHSLSAEDLATIEDAIDALDERLSALEARKEAERKLLELEDALEETGIQPDEDGVIKLH
jgi:hypothetical protein